MRQLLNSERQLSQNLLNRLQAEDFRTFSALQYHTGSFVADAEGGPVQKPKTDLEELRVLTQAQGLGEPLYDNESDDEFIETLTELGFTQQ